MGCPVAEGYLVHSPWHRKLWDREVRSLEGRMAMAKDSMQGQPSTCKGASV